MADGIQNLPNIQASDNSVAVGSVTVNGSVENLIIGNNNTVYGDEKAPRFLHQLPQPPADFSGREKLITRLLEDIKGHQGASVVDPRIWTVF